MQKHKNNIVTKLLRDIAFRTPVLKYYLRIAGEFFLKSSVVRNLYVCWCALYFALLFIGGNRFQAMQKILKCQKVISVFPASKGGSLVNIICDKMLSIEKASMYSKLLRNFLHSSAAMRSKTKLGRYGKPYIVRLKYPKKNDFKERQGDLILLKPYLGSDEKGVLLISYNDAFEKFLASFNLKKVCEKYRIVLEPSTWGYQDAVYWLFLSLKSDVIVQAQCKEDFDYIEGLKTNLKPIRIGAGDWGDSDVFTAGTGDKKYDLVMVASWQLLKRHRLFFDALAKIKNYINKVCLVGYPAEGRKREDVIADAQKKGVLHLLDIFENISPESVAAKIQASRVNVMLSRREGANKALYESFFCDVPVVLYSGNRGVNKDVINEQTGMLSSDRKLPENLMYMLQNYGNFAPRKWALQHTGYVKSTEKLNNYLKDLAVAEGENWTQNIFFKKNATNPIYAKECDRIIIELFYKELEECLD